MHAQHDSMVYATVCFITSAQASARCDALPLATGYLTWFMKTEIICLHFTLKLQTRTSCLNTSVITHSVSLTQPQAQLSHCSLHCTHQRLTPSQTHGLVLPWLGQSLSLSQHGQSHCVHSHSHTQKVTVSVTHTNYADTLSHCTVSVPQPRLSRHGTVTVMSNGMPMPWQCNVTVNVSSIIKMINWQTMSTQSTPTQ